MTQPKGLITAAAGSRRGGKTDERRDRLDKLKQIQDKGINPYPSVSKRSHLVSEILADFENLKKKEKKVTLAGRLRAKRIHGGVSFSVLEDASGKVQIFFRKDTVGQENYTFYKDLIDLGDFLEVKGTLFNTKTEEQTLEVKEFNLLSKAVRPLPEKWHGLSDVEIRYRQRYLDMVVNPQVTAIFKKRSLIVEKIRELMIEKGYLEVETPILQPIYGGGFARPFKTHHNALDMPLYLRISDEMYLKRLVVGGMDKVFEFCRDFRNEGIDRDHNPEFTILEAMTAYEDYKFSMDLVEEIYEYVAKEIEGTTTLEYQGQKINLKRPWERAKMVDLVKKETGIDYFKIKDAKEAKKLALKLGIEKEKLSGAESIGNIIGVIFEEKVEEKLIQPTIVYDYPVEISPLAKKCPDDPRFTERFEHFILGKEQGNHYSELNDPVDLEQRFVEEKKKLKAGFEEAHQTDDDFIKAIEHGMPPVTGIGIGFDRMVMLFTNSANIKEVILFPTLKSEGHKEEKAGKAKSTMMAVAVLNKETRLKPWQEMNTVAHLNAAFAARQGQSLFFQDTITTKDEETIKLNIQHAIMIKQAASGEKLLNLINQAKEQGLEVAEFTREMLETTDDKKIVTQTAKMKHKDVEYLGVLIFGPKNIVEKLTEEFDLVK